MLRTESSKRTHRQNQLLAGYLASVAGAVNSAGFILIGSFTSHVTGNVGRFADDLALRQSAAPFALLMVISFFAGAFTASLRLDGQARHDARAYASLLFLEAGLLAAFALLSYAMDTRNPRFRDVQAILLCFAMGMQNSFVTRLSGAVVRTTHLTGAVTDLGIECARWFRFWMARIPERARLGFQPVEQPMLPRTLLLLTIVGAFFAGSAIGALLAVYAGGQLSLLVPTAALVAGGIWALRGARVDVERASGSD